MELKPEIPPQPRHPRLTRLLEQNQARLRAERKRAARRLLALHGFNDIIVEIQK